jgi:hypothetical protein
MAREVGKMKRIVFVTLLVLAIVLTATIVMNFPKETQKECIGQEGVTWGVAGEMFGLVYPAEYGLTCEEAWDRWDDEYRGSKLGSYWPAPYEDIIKEYMRP